MLWEHSLPPLLEASAGIASSIQGQKAAMKICGCGPAASKQSTPGYAVLNCVDDTHCREASGSRGLQMFRADDSVGPVATNALVFSVVSSASVILPNQNRAFSMWELLFWEK